MAVVSQLADYDPARGKLKCWAKVIARNRFLNLWNRERCRCRDWRREIDLEDDRNSRSGIDGVPEQHNDSTEAFEARRRIAPLLASLSPRRPLAVEVRHGLRGGNRGRFADVAAAMKVKPCRARAIYKDAMAKLWILANAVPAWNAGDAAA